MQGSLSLEAAASAQTITAYVWRISGRFACTARATPQPRPQPTFPSTASSSARRWRLTPVG